MAAAVSLALAALAAAVLLVVPLGSQVEAVEVSPVVPLERSWKRDERSSE